MAFPLKTLRPRFLLLLGLLLALATFPEGGEGNPSKSKLKCFTCAPDGCKDNQYDARLCKRGSQCFKQTGEDKFDIDDCHTFRSLGEFRQLLHACPSYLEHALEVDGKSFAAEGITICHCKDHLCNPAGQPTSNKVLTFVILLISSVIPAIYGGAAGSF